MQCPGWSAHKALATTPRCSDKYGMRWLLPRVTDTGC